MVFARKQYQRVIKKKRKRTSEETNKKINVSNTNGFV